MLWKYVKRWRKQTASLAIRLTVLYTLSTLGLLIVMALLFFPSFAQLITELQTHTDCVAFTMACTRFIMIVLLFISCGGGLLGYLISRKGLKKIKALEQAMQQISADALDARIDLDKWPMELKPLGLQFNQMLQRLEQTFQQLKQFSSDLAHELRHPLHHLQHLTERLLTTCAAQDEEIYVAYRDELQKLTQLIDQLLFLARTEQSQVKLEKVTIHFSALIQGLFEYYAAWAEDKKITLSCVGEAIYQGDVILLQRALSNVLANALEHTPEGGQIDVAITSQAGQITLTFTDNGEGIDPIHLPQLFQRCYQVDAARSRPGSLGLGLSIVKSIIELHQGRVSIQSIPGQQTVVTICIDCARSLSTASPSTLQSAH